MTWGYVALGVGTGIAGLASAYSSRSAASSQSDAAKAAAAAQAGSTETQIQMQQGMYDKNVARMQPWVTGGQQAQGTLADLMGTSGNTTAQGYGSLTKQFGPGDIQGNLAPNYQFMLGQGEQQLQASAAARGGLMSGQGLKDINNYAQNTAQGGYQQAYENYINNQNMLYNKLSGLSGQGESAAAGVGQQGTQVSGNMANTYQAGVSAQQGYLTSAAAANAAGIVGQGQAIGNSINTGINAGMTMSYLNSRNGVNDQVGPSNAALINAGVNPNTGNIANSGL
jgi:hypothetical protein